MDEQPRAVVDAQIGSGLRSLSEVGAHQLRSMFWSDCLKAHTSAGPEAAARAVAGRAAAGSILLCHDGGHLDGPNPQSH